MSRRKVKKLEAAAPAPTMGIQARYDAAGSGKRMRGWTPPSSGPRNATVGLQKIRDRARDVTRNDWSGKAALQKWTTNLIGTGIVPRMKGDVPKATKKKVVDLWDAWVKEADADGVLNFYGLETLAVRSWLESGEVFARLRPRPITFDMSVPLQVQLVEAEYVPMLDADQWPGMPAGNRIRSGIELNNYGRRVAYWMHREHPGDFSGVVDATMLLRVPAEQVRHMFEPERPGQLRGVSHLSAVLTRLRNLNDYDDAVLERQKIANLFTLFITRPALGIGDEGVDPLTGLPIDFEGSDQVATMQPGLSQELAPGEDVKFANPPEAGTTFSDYMRTQHLGTAAGAGLPYEIFSGDILNVSDRTLRVVMNEFRRFAEQRQWQIIIPMFCDPIRTEWVNQAVLSGALSVSEGEAAKRIEWSPHGWQYIHPVQDVTGKALEIAEGLRSRSSVISERGDDPETVDAERAADKKREDELGLTPPPPTPAGAPPGANPKPAPSQPMPPAKK